MTGERVVSRLGGTYDVSEIRQAYQIVFRNAAAERLVLPDLAEFCHANEPAPRMNDMFAQGRAAGRRDVWLRVQEHLQLNEADLFALYKWRALPHREEKNA